MANKRKVPLPPLEVPVPVYRQPSDEEFNSFFDDPDKYRNMNGTEKFYSSLKYPDDEIGVELDMEN